MSKNSVNVFYVKMNTWRLECWLICMRHGILLISIILNNECTHVGAIWEKKNCLEHKNLFWNYKVKKANIEPDVSFRSEAIPMLPTSINSPSYQKLKEAKIIQIFLFIHSSYLRWTDSVLNSSLSNVPSFSFPVLHFRASLPLTYNISITT